MEKVFIILICLVFLFIFFKKSLFESQSIPQVVHKIFLNSDMKEIPIESNIKSAMDTWKLPGYTLKIWYGNDCREYLIKNFDKSYIECFDNIVPYAFKADFMRYCILFNEGGWYSDWQQILLSSLEPYKKYYWVSCLDTTGEENTINKCMQNGFFGCCKNNEILKECINQVIKNVKEKNYGRSFWYPTGPCLLGEAFRKINPKNVKIGYTINDEKAGPCYVIDSKKIIINKCCSDINLPATNFKNGNNYMSLWKEQKIYR